MDKEKISLLFFVILERLELINFTNLIIDRNYVLHCYCNKYSNVSDLFTKKTLYNFFS